MNAFVPSNRSPNPAAQVREAPAGRRRWPLNHLAEKVVNRFAKDEKGVPVQHKEGGVSDDEIYAARYFQMYRLPGLPGSLQAVEPAARGEDGLYWRYRESTAFSPRDLDQDSFNEYEKTATCIGFFPSMAACIAPMPPA